VADFQGAIFLHTWNGGSIDGLTIDKNTVFWNPYESAAALINDANSSSVSFQENFIDSTSPWLLDSKTNLKASRNQYRYFGAGNPRWRFEGTAYDGLAAAQRAGQETASQLSSQPLEQWGHGVRGSISLDHFAAQAQFGNGWTSLTSDPHVWIGGHSWRLYVELPGTVGADGLPSEEATRQLVILRSLAAQYRASGLEVTLLFTQPSRGLKNMVGDMSLAAMDITVANTDANTHTLKTILVSPEGNIAGEWHGFTGPVPLGLALRRALGEPVFSQMGISR
jgi:hypothetical protein